MGTTARPGGRRQRRLDVPPQEPEAERAGSPPAESPTAAERQPPQKRLLRRGWVGIAQIVGCAAIAAAAAAAIYAERTSVRAGVSALHHIQVTWVLAGFAAEFMSMIALAQLERGMLRGVGARYTLRSVLATAYTTNVIAVTVPIVGSGIATAYGYREFRRAGTPPELVSMALTIAGVFSSVAFAIVVAAGALVTGNPAAATAALAGSVALGAAVLAIMLALRFPRARDWLISRVIAALRLSRRIVRRPRSEPGPLVTSALDRLGGLRLGYLNTGLSFGWAMVNWIADVACLVCAIKAVGEPVPWAAILIIWSAGMGAGSFSPVPAGIGVVDIVLIAALATAGLHDAKAVAAVLLYRIISLKPFISVGWLGYHFVANRRWRAKRALQQFGEWRGPAEHVGGAEGQCGLVPDPRVRRPG